MKLADDADLLRSWDYDKNSIIGLSPETLKSKSNKKAWWKCPKGHSWQREIYRQSEKRTCPYCCNKQVLVGYNDLCTLFPDIAKEWDSEKNLGKDICTYVKGSSQRIWWICSKCHHSWITSIRARTLRGSGCPQCAKKQRVKTKNETFLHKRGCLNIPLLLKEWHPKNPAPPENFTRASNEMVWWQCSKCQYEWQAKISNRSILGRGCPCCANKAVVPGKNDLATTHPELSKEWHPTKNGTLRPNQVLAGSAAKVWWLCPKGHEYRASLLHRGHGTGCPECNSGRQTSFAEQAIF